MNFHILIVEDDLLIAEMLKEMLLELGYGVSGIAKDYPATVSLLKHSPAPELCFVDINLQAKESGFDVARLLNEEYHIPFVFLTSYSDRKTIEEAGIHLPEAYLVKPFSPTDLLTTVEIIRARRKDPVTASSARHIVIKDGGLNIKLSTSDIRWLKSDNIYVEVQTKEKVYLVRQSLERFLEELQDPAFLRTHRSYAVNIHQVQAVNSQYLLLGPDKIPLSRKFRDEILEKFKTGKG